ncbi:MAG TPA: GntR family transcriptional regulator [Clostridiales bacterium]|nr:GntR family transcriptional regulator [Clostridiales bacterium]
MIHLDLHDPRPMYEQVVDQMEMLALRGVLEPDSRLPSVRQMAMELSLNPNTVQKAYAELLNRGVIYSVRGKGNFVSADCSSIRQTKLDEIRAAIAELIQQARELGASPGQCNTLLQSLMEVEQS